MEEMLMKVFSLVYKPTHYFLVGIGFIGWNRIFEKEPTFLLLSGIILVMLSLASFIDYMIKIVKKGINYFISKQKKKEAEQKRQALYNSRIRAIQSEYKQLKGKEKEIIEHCLRNNSRAFKQSTSSFDNYSEAITSLIAKGFAKQGSNFYILVLNDVTWDALTKKDEV